MAGLDVDTTSFAEDAEEEFDLLVLSQRNRRFEAVPIARRADGFLLGVPVGVWPPSRLATAQTATPTALLGPSTVVQVPLQGAVDPDVEVVQVLLVDVSLSMCAHLQLFRAEAELDVTSFADGGRLPSGVALVADATIWLQGHGVPRRPGGCYGGRTNGHWRWLRAT